MWSWAILRRTFQKNRKNSLRILERESKSERSADKATFGMWHFFPLCLTFKDGCGQHRTVLPKMC